MFYLVKARYIMAHPWELSDEFWALVSHSWMNRNRKLPMRLEKTDASYMAPLHLAVGKSPSGRKNLFRDRFLSQII